MLRLLAILLVGCGTGTDPVDSGTTPATGSGTTTTTTAASTITASARQSDRVAAVWWIDWTPGSPGATHRVDYGLNGELTLQTAETETASVPLLGLKAGRTYSWQAVSRWPDGTEVRSEVQTLATDPPPAALRVPQLTAHSPSADVASGFVQFSMTQPVGDGWVLMFDGDGDLVWWEDATDQHLVLTSRFSDDGRDLLFLELPYGSTDFVGRLVRLALDGSREVVTRVQLGHHDFDVRDDGTVAFLRFDPDPSSSMVGDTIHTIPEGTADPTQAVERFRWLDHATPTALCEHMDAWRPDPTYQEWSHANSLVPHPDGLHDLVMSKYTDAIVKVRRDSGELVWTLGGPDDDFTLPGGGPTWPGLVNPALWSHAHFSDAYEAPAGSGYDTCVAVFDNGLHRVPVISSLVEVCLDETALVAEVTWRHLEPSGDSTLLMGDVRKLPTGWLAGWSKIARVEELADDGTVRWQLTLDPTTSSGRLDWRPTLGG